MDRTPVQAEEDAVDRTDNLVPDGVYDLNPLVGPGGSAGGISALTSFFRALPPDSGLAFAVVLHLSPEHESTLAELLQCTTDMPVVQVAGATPIEKNTVYVIPPRHGAPTATARLASSASRSAGGLTVAQDPDEARHTGMPRSSIATGMVDWVLPVAEIPRRLLDYFKLEDKLQLPPEEGREPVQPAQPDVAEEVSLRDVLNFLRTRTGRHFSYYKRATILRRVARRMHVNGVQDLLISVTNFFRDADCFEALDREIPALLAGKGPNDTVRVWVPACATGEEAYSIAIRLAERTRSRDVPPVIQVFATDLDGDAVQTAREGIYPTAIEADESEERLKRYFVTEHHGHRVRRELREMVLFARHDVLKDSPFSRLDLISCRNLHIYLNRDAQARVLDIFHFALLPGARLFLGSSESVEDGNNLFGVVDKKQRIYQQRPMPRAGLPVPWPRAGHRPGLGEEHR